MLFFKAQPQRFHLHQMFLHSLELLSVRSCWFWRLASAYTSCINSELAHLLCMQEPICFSSSCKDIVLEIRFRSSELKCDVFYA